MWFRLDTNEVFHTRIEYDIISLLGDIGGTAEILTKITVFILGGYLSFHSSIEIIKSLYKHDKEIKAVSQVF